MNSDLWQRAESLGLSAPALAALLGCSEEDLQRWTSGQVHAPPQIEARLLGIVEDGGLWQEALADRPPAVRKRKGGPIERWIAQPLLLLLFAFPFFVFAVLAVLVTAF